MQVFTLTVLLALLPWLCRSQTTTCNVVDYGAKGDGKSNDTEAFLKAFRACASSGGAPPHAQERTVLVPRGKFLVWPLRLSSHECSYLVFHIQGEILAPPDPASWTYNVSYLLFDDCQGLTITGIGGGQINGQGDLWWNLRRRNSSIEGPKLIIIDHSKNVTVQDIKLHDSPMFHLVPKNSENVAIEYVNITAPTTSPNTDGIDPSNSHNVAIRYCYISTGDDNVALKSGTTNVLIENCVFEFGHGCSIGSINETGVQNVLVGDVSFFQTEMGARIKTWQGGSGVVQNIIFINLSFKEVGIPIVIDMYYCPHSHCKNSSKGGYII